MKAKLLPNALFVTKQNDVRSDSDEKSISVELEMLKTIAKPWVFFGKENHRIRKDMISVTEPETADEILYLLNFVEEVKNHKRILVIPSRTELIDKGFYFDKDIPALHSIGSKYENRMMFVDMVMEIADEENITLVMLEPGDAKGKFTLYDEKSGEILCEGDLNDCFYYFSTMK